MMIAVENLRRNLDRTEVTNANKQTKSNCNDKKKENVTKTRVCAKNEMRILLSKQFEI